MSKPTCRALCCVGAGCLSGVATYLPSLCYMGAGCLSGVATYLLALFYRGAGCLSVVGTYLPALCYRLFKHCHNLSAGTVLQRCRLFKLCWNLPSRHCVAGVQAVYVVSEPTCRALFCKGAGCLSDVGTYLPGTVLQGCRLFKWCQNLPAGHCVVGVQSV